MHHDILSPDMAVGLRRSLLLSFLGSMALLWWQDDLVILGVVVTVVAVGLLADRNKAQSLDRAMAAMVGGTIGGFLGACTSLILTATWQQGVPSPSMSVMTASMAGMIGGALGGSWPLIFIPERTLRQARTRRSG